jgi:ElaB/YqjD/DUF883 family membrane-anchored ribosome-binding protein
MANGYESSGQGRSWEGQTGQGTTWEDQGQRAADWAQSSARGVAEKAREGMEQASGYMRDAVERTKEKVAEYRENGMERVRDDVMTYTREQPVSALLIAAGAGLLIGWLTSMGRR